MLLVQFKEVQSQYFEFFFWRKSENSNLLTESNTKEIIINYKNGKGG